MKFFENDFVFLQGDTESDLREKIWLVPIVPNIVYSLF